MKKYFLGAAGALFFTLVTSAHAGTITQLSAPVSVTSGDPVTIYLGTTNDAADYPDIAVSCPDGISDPQKGGGDCNEHHLISPSVTSYTDRFYSTAREPRNVNITYTTYAVGGAIADSRTIAIQVMPANRILNFSGPTSVNSGEISSVYIQTTNAPADYVDIAVSCPSGIDDSQQKGGGDCNEHHLMASNIPSYQFRFVSSVSSPRNVVVTLNTYLPGGTSVVADSRSLTIQVLPGVSLAQPQYYPPALSPETGPVYVPHVSPQSLNDDVGPTDIGSVCTALTYNLKYRSRDAQSNGEVTLLQSFLNDRGYLSAEPSGYYGLATVAAVKLFQSANGISQVGTIGALSRAKIRQLTCDLAQSETKSPSSTELQSQLGALMEALRGLLR